MNEVVGNIRNRKFDITLPKQWFMKNEMAVHPVRQKIAGNIAEVKGNITVCYKKGTEPGQKGSVEGINTADYEEQNEFAGKEVVSYLFKYLQMKCSFQTSTVSIMAGIFFFVNFCDIYFRGIEALCIFRGEIIII